MAVDTNATGIYKPIIASCFVFSPTIESSHINSLEEIKIFMESKPESRGLNYLSFLNENEKLN